ncbi:MAG: DNA polymerase III subunit [Longimicrobiales bacterium]|nr:DNA polymerase III subunit [Longimicrobiales bacterium]
MRETRTMIHDVVGHEEARQSLARAIAAGTLPSALLLLGPRGIGKQRVALWTAQLVLCDAPTPAGPCDACRHCSRVRRLEHPDLHWHMPLPRPRGASTPEKLQDALEVARAEHLQELRDDPLRFSRESRRTAIYLAAARTIRRAAQSRPSEGREQIFIIGDAERLVPQESSPEAANALLKLLEEPPTDTRFILTSSEPGRLLDTIRSRTVPLHLAPLDTHQVQETLVRLAGADPEAARHAAVLGEGSIGTALGYLPDGDEAGPLEALRRRAARLVQAALQNPGEGYRIALTDFGASDGQALIDLLDHVDRWLRDLATAAAHATVRAVSVDAHDWLDSTVEKHALHPVDLARALEHVETARVEARGNVSPQLVVAGLVSDLHERLTRAPSPTGGAR